MKTLTSQSTANPPEWDTDSSPDIIYHNTNAVLFPATDDAPAMYGYTQEQYTPGEYSAYLRDKLISEIEETQDNIMLALTAMYESEAT